MPLSLFLFYAIMFRLRATINHNSLNTVQRQDLIRHLTTIIRSNQKHYTSCSVMKYKNDSHTKYAKLWGFLKNNVLLLRTSIIDLIKSLSTGNVKAIYERIRYYNTT